MWEDSEVTISYKGFRLSGWAWPIAVDGTASGWYARGDVTIFESETVVRHIAQVDDPFFVDDDKIFAKLTGLFLAEIAVDNVLPPSTYYLAPMNVAWAVDMLRNAAERFVSGKVNSPELYKALDYLEDFLALKRWMVRKFRVPLRVGGRDEREKAELQEQLAIATRVIQSACADRIVSRMNELACNFRENKQKIDGLRKVLENVRKPVGRSRLTDRRNRARV